MMKWWGWGSEKKAFSLDNRPGFWPFVALKLKNKPLDTETLPTLEQIKLPPTRLNKECLLALHEALSEDQIKTDNLARIEHSYGRNYRDLLRVWENKIETAPDAVVYPLTHEHVVRIMAIASEFNVIVIPYGGGTNVVGALEAPHNEERMVLSVDMQRMNKVVSINEEDQTAVIEAGAQGKEMEEQLNALGYTLGHFPDSFEYSTLGGWIAMRSSGMQSDGNGNIEDMLVNATMVSPNTVITTPISPRFSSGPDVNQIILGSEGCFGIITQATLKVIKFETLLTHAFLFPNFETAVQTIRICRDKNRTPKMFRVSDAPETEFISAASPKASTFQKFAKKILHQYLIRWKKFDMHQACLAFVSFHHGDIQEQKDILALCKKNNAVNLGAKIAEKWFKTKYDPPYLRDVFMEKGLIGDTVETSVSWKNLLTLHDAVISKANMFFEREFGGGSILCHLSHTYANGACLYFTLAVHPGGADKLVAYCKIKKFIVDLFLEHGGSISHHHSIGYEHMPWVNTFLGSGSIYVLKSMKNTLDPNNICNPGKLIPNEEVIKHYWPNITD